MKRIMAVVLFASMMVSGAALRAAPLPLDGTMWKIHYKGIRSLMFWRSDKMVFLNGKFITTSAQSAGYAPGGYAITVLADGGWISTITHINGNQMVWEGRVSGTFMRGDYTLVQPTGERSMVSWTATLGAFEPRKPEPASSVSVSTEPAVLPVQPLFPGSPIR